MKPISLGQTSEFIMPPTSMKYGKNGGKDEVDYPCTHLEGGKELSKLPEQGEITFRFKRKSYTERGVEGEDGGVSLCLELQEVLDSKEGKALKSTDDALAELKNSSDDTEEDDGEEGDD